MAGEKLETVAVEQKPEEISRVNNFGEFWAFFKSELKPKGSLSTVFNLLSGVTIVFGIIFVLLRFTMGLGHPITNLNQSFPWGMLVGFYIMSGGAFGAAGSVLAFIVYVLGLKKYSPLLRAAILNSFLFYLFCAVAMIVAFGRWWNIPNVFLGNAFGVSSVLFVVLWLLFLYILTSALEFSPAFAEWIVNKKLRKTVGSLTFGAIIFGITLSILHQAGLGALLVMAKGKIHPLWYSEFLPVMFLISSIYAGLAMIIFEGTISQKVFSSQIDDDSRNSMESILIGLARICGGVIFAYFAVAIILAQGEGDLRYINTSMGYWWLLEMIGFVAIPGLMFIHGAQKKNALTIRNASVFAMVGIILNRYNDVFIAYNWTLPFGEKYYPSFIEGVITLAILFVQIWAFRWIVNRMPVVRKSPQWASTFDKDKS
jgi:Ni/Fe-hydrogenase subunit HybB-like protein